MVRISVRVMLRVTGFRQKFRGVINASSPKSGVGISDELVFYD